MRFNNTLAAVMLGAAQVAFLAGIPRLGWTFALAVVAAASVALAGFCVGCLLFTQWRIRTRRWRAGQFSRSHTAASIPDRVRLRTRQDHAINRRQV